MDFIGVPILNIDRIIFFERIEGLTNSMKNSRFKNSRFFKIFILLVLEVVVQIGLILTTEHMNTYSMSLNVIVGIIVAIIYMAYWDSAREFRLKNLELTVKENKISDNDKIIELSNEILQTKQELERLKKRVHEIEEK